MSAENDKPLSEAAPPVWDAKRWNFFRLWTVYQRKELNRKSVWGPFPLTATPSVEHRIPITFKTALKKRLEETEDLICFKKENMTLQVSGTFLKNPELFIILKLLFENTRKDPKEEGEG